MNTTERLTITCTDEGHWHCGKSAEIRDPGQPVDAGRACKLIDLAWHPVLSKAASVQRLGPWAKPAA